MTACERYQAQLLDHLYDLLEAGERQELLAHLSICEPCQSALEQTRLQQRLIAAAAKTKFDAVRFEKPASDITPKPAAPATPILLMPAKPRRGWVRYAAAAAVLFVLLTGFAVSGQIYLTGAGRIKQELAQVDAERTQINEKFIEVSAPTREKADLVARVLAEQQELAKKENEKREETTRTALGKQRYLTVTGPDTIQDGAANVFTVAIRGLDDQPVDMKLRPRLVNPEGKSVVDEKLLAMELQGPGQYRLSLPRNLDLKSATNVLLELATEDEQRSVKKDANEAASFRTALKIARPVYITHLATDKPMYQPGQTVWFRSLTVERFSLKPAEEPLHLLYSITDANGGKIADIPGSTQLVDAQNMPVLGPDNKPLKGLGSGSFQIPPNFPGGEYTLVVSDRYNHFPAEQRKFIVNEYQKSALNMKLEYTKKSFGPGDEVIAACEVKPSAGGRPVARQPVTATVRIDGKTYGADGQLSDAGLKFQTDDAGNVAVKFRLPTQIEKGQASLAVQFTDGANVDAIVRAIPIVLKKFYVQLYPEGGDLVAGVPNRVYFQARTTLDKPAELAGRVVDQDARVIARLETLNDAREPGANQGMGVFEFTPVAGRKYQLQIDSPAGIVADYEFPAIKTEGVVLNVPRGVMKPSESLRVRVNDSQGGRTLLVGAYCRGRLLAHETFQSKKGEFQEIDLKPEGGIGGVYRVTVFEQRDTTAGRQYVPRAERLVYRAPAESLKLSMQPHRQKFMPGEKVMLNFNSQDESGKPTAAIIMLAVVDRTILSMMDEKTARAMPTQLFLGTEIRKPEDFEHADFLLGQHPKAAAALDLLLGTQGWRRFAEQNPEEFQKKHGADATRMLAAAAFTPIEINNKDQIQALANGVLQEELQRLAFDTSKRVAEVQDKLNKAQAEVNQAHAAVAQKVAELRQEANRVDNLHSTVALRLDSYNQAWRFAGMLAGGVVLLLVGVVGVIIGILRRGRAAIPYFATAACSIIVLAGGLLYITSQDLKRDGMAKANVDGIRAAWAAEQPKTSPAVDELLERRTGARAPARTEMWKDEAKKADDHFLGGAGRGLMGNGGVPKLEMPPMKAEGAPVVPPAPGPAGPAVNRAGEGDGRGTRPRDARTGAPKLAEGKPGDKPLGGPKAAEKPKAPVAGGDPKDDKRFMGDRRAPMGEERLKDRIELVEREGLLPGADADKAAAARRFMMPAVAGTPAP
jgi:hypothetical protein